jgi:hypothetical protein
MKGIRGGPFLIERLALGAVDEALENQGTILGYPRVHRIYGEIVVNQIDF